MHQSDDLNKMVELHGAQQVYRWAQRGRLDEENRILRSMYRRELDKLITDDQKRTAWDAVAARRPERRDI